MKPSQRTSSTQALTKRLRSASSPARLPTAATSGAARRRKQSESGATRTPAWTASPAPQAAERDVEARRGFEALDLPRAGQGRVGSTVVSPRSDATSGQPSPGKAFLNADYDELVSRLVDAEEASSLTFLMLALNSVTASTVAKTDFSADRRKALGAVAGPGREKHLVEQMGLRTARSQATQASKFEPRNPKSPTYLRTGYHELNPLSASCSRKRAARTSWSTARWCSID